MITKFKNIKNFAVFQNFIWDNTVKDGSNNIQTFKDINIIYGRNYSGKTTLSRIVRALESGIISEKYENPEFELSIKDKPDLNQINLNTHGKKIRVFNEDFIKENLRFIVNPDESIKSFAILGGNANIEKEITELKEKLGKSEPNAESGLYLELKNASKIASTAQGTFEFDEKKLNDQLKYKAINSPHGIKYNSERFGEQNYNITKLEADIETVLHNSYQPLNDEDVKQKITLLNEKVNNSILSLPKVSIDFNSIYKKAEILITKPISSSDKIDLLLKNAILNRWVKDGRQLHRDKIEKCSFCGNDISEDRWKELDSHFDEESEKLEKEISALKDDIKIKIESLNSCLQINKATFYFKFHKDLDRLIAIRNHAIKAIVFQLNQIDEKLTERKDDILNTKSLNNFIDHSKRIEWILTIFENIKNASNSYSNSIGADQKDARKLLRLKEVYDFINTIQYLNQKNRIKELEEDLARKKEQKGDVESEINRLLVQIQEKERLMNDEEKGALKVNEYLNNFFGHDFLTLQALEDNNQLGGKKIRFEIIRNGKKAHHLSEGECSLVAFCYFMAKLEDIETLGHKPIIWIDDPISSLDNNHIFFIYSLINAEIVLNQSFEQLFISTHNLDFLKYLKRITNPPRRDFQRAYFIVIREGVTSTFKLMPKYLKDYVTEFNFLFHQIYLCANADTNDQALHNLYYNFANNARKFLEAFLFYKYPNAQDKDDKLTRFFGYDKQASSMADRINNEFSHLEGLFERSMTPIDIPEMKKTAAFILDKIKEKDFDQYEALLISIGVQTTS